MCLGNKRKIEPSLEQPETENNENLSDLNKTEIANSIKSFRFKSEPYHKPANKIHGCDRCTTSFDYEHDLLRHKKLDHLNPDTDFKQYFADFSYLGSVKNTPKEAEPVVGKIEEIIVNNKVLKIVYMNVNSIQSKNKQQKVGRGVIDSKADIVILAETKLHKNSQEFKVQGYYQAKSLTRRAGAGGLLVMAKKTVKIHSIVAKNVLPEIQVIQFEFNGQTIISVYRSPTVKLMSVPERVHHKTFVDHLENRIKKLKDKPYVLVGDFNLGSLAECDFDPDLRASGFDDDSGSIGTKTYINQIWSDFYFNHCLQQWVCEPTFPSHQSILDILMTPVGQNIKLDIGKDLFKGNFDHYALIFEIDTNFETNETPRTRRVKTHANWQKFRDILIREKIHTHIHTKQTTNEMARFITSKVKAAYDEAIPEVIVKPPKDCYLHKETKRYTRKATKLRQKRRTFAPNSPEFISIQNKLKILDKCIDEKIKHDRAYYQTKKLEISKNQRKNFFTHFKEAKGKPSINITGPVLDLDGILKTSDQDVADSFGNLMGEQLKPGKKPTVNWFEPYPEAMKSTNKFYVSIEMVKKQIGLSRNGAACGPDGIPMEAFAVASDILAEPLSVLFNFINQSGEIPELFKISRVKMLYKKNEKSDMLNYRPLAMSSHLGKLWERVVNCHLMDHLENNKHLSNRQFGFRRNMGTTENLLKLHEHITDKLEAEGCTLEIWSFDLQKAFDKLDHAKVLNLLHKSGVNGFLGLSIQNWLINRKQYVEVGNCKSDETCVGRSCVQGSVLGPTLWLLYIQSLTTKLDSLGIQYFAYADDISIVQKLKTDQDKIDFENSLETLQKWSENYDMQWSPLKTQRLVLKYQNCPEPTPPFQMFFGGKEIIPMETSCTSLGAIIGRSCSFKEQRKKVCSTIKSLTGLMLQSLEGLTPDLVHRYYQVYIMPNLIYCCQVWQSGDETQLQPIVNAISKFWKLSPAGKPPKDFIEPRILFILFDLNYVKKMKDGRSPLDFDEIFKISTTGNTRENLEEKLAAPTFRLEISRYKFSNRVRPYWNSLPKDIRHLSYNSFKKEAKTYVLNNSERFLNFGNRNRARPRDLPEIVPYIPPKVATTIQTTIKNKINKPSTSVKRLNKEIKIVKPVDQNTRIHKAAPIIKPKKPYRPEQEE